MKTVGGNAGGRDAVTGMGRGSPQPTKGSGEASWALPAGFGVQPRTKTILVGISLRRTPLVALCCKLVSRQQTSVGARNWLKVENFIIIRPYWTGAAGRYILQRPECDIKGSWGAKILIYANDWLIIRRGMGYPSPQPIRGSGECREFPQRDPGQSPDENYFSGL